MSADPIVIPEHFQVFPLKKYKQKNNLGLTFLSLHRAMPCPLCEFQSSSINHFSHRADQMEPGAI